MKIKSIFFIGFLKRIGSERLNLDRLALALGQGPAHDPLTGSDRFDGTVIDNLNGSYTVNFEIQRPGYYNMRVFLNDQEIGPSPFMGVLIWDDLSAPLTVAIGPGTCRKESFE